MKLMALATLALGLSVGCTIVLPFQHRLAPEHLAKVRSMDGKSLRSESVV